MHRVEVSEFREALKKMKPRKNMGPDSVLLKFGVARVCGLGLVTNLLTIQKTKDEKRNTVR